MPPPDNNHRHTNKGTRLGRQADDSAVRMPERPGRAQE